MRKLLLSLSMIAVLAISGALSGCTLTETAQERNRRIRNIASLQMRMLVEDIDAFLLLDRNSQLASWNTQVGY